MPPPVPPAEPGFGELWTVCSPNPPSPGVCPLVFLLERCTSTPDQRRGLGDRRPGSPARPPSLGILVGGDRDTLTSNNPAEALEGPPEGCVRRPGQADAALMRPVVEQRGEVGWVHPGIGAARVLSSSALLGLSAPWRGHGLPPTFLPGGLPDGLWLARPQNRLWW